MSDRVRYLIDLYIDSPLSMTPQSFYRKYPVTYEHMALICSRSSNTVARWFSHDERFEPNQKDLRHLAEVDLLLEYYEEIPEIWLNRLCLKRNLW